uniref:sigma factor-like helix-turn-helix DNA-binding protein n=1 Tax=Nocardia farcinica TaxID=37329 RepID=UPI00313AAEC9
MGGGGGFITRRGPAVFVLHAAFVYPHREIAEKLDVSDSAALQAYHRATQRVRLGRN